MVGAHYPAISRGRITYICVRLCIIVTYILVYVRTLDFRYLCKYTTYICAL